MLQLQPSSAPGARHTPSRPRARGLPWLGSSVPLLRDPLAFLQQEHAQLGPIFEVRAPTRRFVVMAGQEANRFLSREGRDTLVAAPFWHRLTIPEYDSRNAILGLDGDAHSRVRHAMRSSLSKATVEAHQSGVTQRARRACARLEAGVATGESVSVPDLTRLMVSRVIHHVLSAGTEEPVPESLALDMMERFRWESNARLLGKWPAATLRLRAHRLRRQRVVDFGDQLIAQARAGKTSPWGEVGLWLEREANPPLSQGDLRFHFLFPFVGGVDTVAATLGFWLYEVLRSPRHYATLRAAVDEVYAQSEAPSEKELRACAPLLGSVMEALRLYPSAFGIYRNAAVDFEFEGYRVAAGEDVMVFTTACHFDARYFPTPARFDLHRAGESQAQDAGPAEPNQYRQKSVFMPYGVGPHICLGASMGETLLLRLSAFLLRTYDLELCASPLGRAHTFDPSLAPHPGLRVRATGLR